MSIQKPFEKWKTQEVENIFGIKIDYDNYTLQTWLAANYEVPEPKHTFLVDLKIKLGKFIDYYNESDISMFFISHVLTAVDFVQEEYRAYTQLSMKAKIKNIHGVEVVVGGKVEMAVAKGKQIPETPFFFLNEYKPEKRTGSESDPKGQLLIAMLAAQSKNQDEYPIYGCYVNGRNWHFVVLEGKKYAVSDAYVATQDAIFQIYSILMEAKRYIHQRLNLSF